MMFLYLSTADVNDIISSGRIIKSGVKVEITQETRGNWDQLHSIAMRVCVCVGVWCVCVVCAVCVW